MAIVGRSIRTFIIASSIALTATAASGQSGPPAGAGGFQKDELPNALQISDGESMAAHLKFGMTRAAAIDADLKALIDDMNMFVGEMKVETMARAVTLLVERLSTVRQQMTAMHEVMMHMSTGPVWGESSTGRSTMPPADEVEPEAMCREVRF
jgi:hypothetical protein